MEFEIDLKGFERFVKNSTKAEVSEKRRTLSRAINGDLFYPVKMWPKHMKFIFWKKQLVTKAHSSYFCSWLAMVVRLQLQQNGC